MARSRLKTILRLGVLLGMPVVCVAGLVGAGVYVGVTHRHQVASFERDYLQIDVEVPPPESQASPASTPPDPGGGTEPQASEINQGHESPGDAPPASAQVQQPVSVPVGSQVAVLAPGQEPASVAQEGIVPGADPTAVPGAGPTAVPGAGPTAVPGAPTAPIPGAPGPLVSPAVVDPLQGKLAKQLQLPVTVHLKVLVDPELIAEKDAWIDYIQRTVSRASQIYVERFGITLEPVAIGRWHVATAGMDAITLLADLQGRPREGADVLVGVTNRPLDGRVSGLSENPMADSPFNGAHALVYSTPSHPEPHLRTLLHELAHIFGAEDITDPRHPDWQAGSWMSYAPVRPGQAPWIDTRNRERILQRKDKPFAPENVVRQSPAPAGAGGG